MLETENLESRIVKSDYKILIVYDVMSNGSSNYLKLAQEVLQRNENKVQNGN